MSQPPYPSQPQEPYGQPYGQQPPAGGGNYGQPSGDQYGQPASGGQYGQPSGGQYGQPSYGQPSSGAPQGGYPPPGGTYPPPGDAYPPPGGGYPPPGGGAPQFGGQPAGGPPPKKKSNALKIVLIVVAVLAVLCAAGIGGVYFFAKDKVEEVVDGAKITVAAPTTLGGRSKITDPEVAQAAEELDKELGKVGGATSSVGAMYGDVAKQDIVMVAAASTVSGSAQARFDEFTKGMASGGMATGDLTDTDPGPLGGIAKCGETNQAGVKMAICVWSDNGSTGMFAMFFKTKAQLEKEFVTLRGEVEKKA